MHDLDRIGSLLVASLFSVALLAGCDVPADEGEGDDAASSQDETDELGTAQQALCGGWDSTPDSPDIATIHDMDGRSPEDWDAVVGDPDYTTTICDAYTVRYDDADKVVIDVAGRTQWNCAGTTVEYHWTLRPSANTTWGTPTYGTASKTGTWVCSPFCFCDTDVTIDASYEADFYVEALVYAGTTKLPFQFIGYD